MTRKPIDDARVWMGKLPREDFEKLLLLTNEAHRRGAREAIHQVRVKVSRLSQRALPLPGLKKYLEQLWGGYPR